MARTVLLTTQYLEEAEQLADRIAILHEGKIIANGTLVELKKRFPARKGGVCGKTADLGGDISRNHWQKGGKVNGNDTETLFQRYERDAWTFHAPYFPQHGHHHHGHRSCRLR